MFDSSGGAIAGAKVTITDVARGTTRVLMTDGVGEYTAPSLLSGTYSVRAESAGFRTTERSNVLLEVLANVRVDLTLSPGEQAQTITVTQEVPAIDTTSATLGGTVTNRSILALPLNGRNFVRLLDLRPGVVRQPGASAGATSTNGRRLGADVLLVEGITQFDIATANNLINGNGKGSSGDASSLIPIDAIQEFSTQQDAPAEYGWRDGSVINVGIKSGTNSLHGTAYAFGRDATATDAANFFTNTVTPATLEQFGATAGGRILKDKLFWFASFEGLRVDIASISSVTIPSDVTGSGANLSMVDACNSVKAGGGAINPLSAQLAGLNAANCTVSPATNTFENVFPYNPSTSNLFYPGNPTTQPLNNGLAKLDYNLNDRNHLSFFYFDSRSVQHSGGSLQPYWNTTGTLRTEEYAGSWTWTPSSVWVNEARLGWAGSFGDSEPGDQSRIPAEPYPTGYSMNTGVTNPEFGGFPNITFTSGFTPLGVGGRTGRRGPEGQLNVRDSVSYLRGKHAFKFGVEHVWIKFDDDSTQSTWGNIAFANLTSFLEGIPVNGSIIDGNTDESFRERWWAGFVQDIWRVTNRVTLTPGLRYEYQGSPHSTTNDLGIFDPTVPGGIALIGPGSALYNAPKRDIFPRVGVAWDIRGNGKTVMRAGIGLMGSFPSLPTIVEPTPFGATLFNAAGQVVVDRRGTQISENFPNTLSFTGAQLQAGWNTTGPVFPISSTSGPTCTVAVPCSTGALDPNFKRQKSLQWNWDVQRAITNRLTVDLAYVGNHGYHEFFSEDLNAVPQGTGYTPAVIAACLASAGGTKASATACTPDSSAIVAARPYNAAFPYYNYIVRNTTGFYSNYNGLQVTLDARNFHGLSLLTAYTYSHALDMFSAGSSGTLMLEAPNNPRLQYANGDQDLRHRLRFSPTWLIPGKKGWAQSLEGWSVSGTLAVQGGFPWSAIDSTKNDWVGAGENNNAFSTSNSGVLQYWNYSGPVSAFNSSYIPIPCSGALAGCTAYPVVGGAPQPPAECVSAAQAPYAGNPTLQALALKSLLNNACYERGGGILTPPAYGTIGNAGRNIFRGPGFDNVDMSVAKVWTLKERYSAEFRAEFFNLFNTPTFALPGTNPASGATGKFGYATTTADSSNPVVGSGGPRHIQFGLKLLF